MSTSKDLLLAILAMDSYNRGYGAGIEIGAGNIGESIYNDHEESGITQEEYQAWQDAGFYAVSYNTPYGTVISYRGTDNPDPLTTADGASDLWNGWVSGAGFPAGQSELAFEFFEAVTGSDAFEGEAQGVVLTGHSLGGGLAA